EMAMRGLGQIRALARTARPDLGLITSIAPVHLGLLGSLENIARAKAEAPELEPFVPAGLELRRFAPPEAEVRDGVTRFEFRGREVAFRFAARHQAANAAAALEVADALGVPPPEEPVEVRFSRWRSEEHELPGGGLLVNDAWNANPVAM